MKPFATALLASVFALSAGQSISPVTNPLIVMSQHVLLREGSWFVRKLDANRPRSLVLVLKDYTGEKVISTFDVPPKANLLCYSVEEVSDDNGNTTQFRLRIGVGVYNNRELGVTGIRSSTYKGLLGRRKTSGLTGSLAPGVALVEYKYQSGRTVVLKGI